MSKFNARELAKKNDKEFERIAGWLKQGPKVVMQAAVTRAHSTVMQSQHLGGKMIHDSSNAAYNWRISLGAMPGVLMSKGTPPVGNEGDHRTAEGKTDQIISTIMARLSKDAANLDKAIWGYAKIGKVSLVNPIGGKYAIFAQLDDAIAGGYWQTVAMSAAESAFNNWMESGPSVNWARHSKATYGASYG